jgi:hypothetical protein
VSVSLFAAAPSDEVVVDHTSSKGPVVRTMRGTLLATSIARLKETGHYERYLAELPSASSDAILYALPMSWVPIELMLTHCHACDRLELSHEILMQLGSQTASTIMQTFFQKLLHASGLSPWVAMESIGRLWDRIHEGGAVTLIRKGPKDVYIEQRGNPLASSRYFTTGAQGFYNSLAELFSNKAYVRAVKPRQADANSFAFVVSWV